MKILVVEDHVLMREALRGVLKELKGDAALPAEKIAQLSYGRSCCTAGFQSGQCRLGVDDVDKLSDEAL